jgi:hypothetical protein
MALALRSAKQVRYARLCRFCRKARGKIRELCATSFQRHARRAERAGFTIFERQHAYVPSREGLVTREAAITDLGA